MDDSKLIKWLYEKEKQERILTLANAYYPVFKTLLNNILKIKRNEIILIVGDTGKQGYRLSPLITMAYNFTGQRLGLKTRIHFEDENNELFDSKTNLDSALKSLTQKATVILNLSNKMGKLTEIKTSFRKYCKTNKIRFVTTTSLGYIKTSDSYKFIKALNIDYKALKEKAIKLKEMMDFGKTIYVSTKKGTSLMFKINRKPAFISDGIYEKFGQGGNLPGGEVYIAPEKDQVEGTLVIDGSCRVKEGTILVKNPVKLTIKKGEVVRIDGREEAEMLRKSIAEAKSKTKGLGARKIGELGIGLNPNATIIGSTIVDEKTLGTAHVAIGTNTSFMGHVVAPIHYDQVFWHPKIRIDGKRIYF